MLQKKKKFLVFITEFAAIAITFLLPLKFASLASVPEMPSTYWNTALEILICAWPLTVFVIMSALLLGLCILSVPLSGNGNRPFVVYVILWIVLALLSVLGIINAASWDFYAQMISYCFGLACYALSLYLLLCNRVDFARPLLWSILIASLFSAASGLYQYAYGFDNTIDFLYAEGGKLGVNMLEGNMQTRLMEQRISADFAVCNVYGGYLAMLLPLILYAFWRLAEKYVEPAKLSRWVLTVPLLILFLFLIKETESRGAILSLGCGIFLVLFCLKMSWKWRMIFLGILFLMIVGFTIMVITGRGFGSMIFRFDYFQAAFRMLLKSPLFGTGWGDFFHDYTFLKVMSNDEAPHTPHNMILLFGSQAGIFAFLASSAIILLPCVCACMILRKVTDWKSDYSAQFIAVLTFTTAIWGLDSMIEVNFETPASVATAIALACILLSHPKMTEIKFLPHCSSDKKIPRTIILISCLCLMLFTFLYGLYYARYELTYGVLFESTNPRYARNDAQRNSSPAQVVQLLNQAVEAAPKSPLPWAAASDYMIGYGELAIAEDYLNEALHRSPERSGYYYRKFRLLYYLPGRRDEAMESLKKARELFPGNPEYQSDIPDRRLPFMP